jgi:hypothetical protein
VALVFAAASLAPLAASAAPLVYNEAVNGDLPELASQLPTLQLDVGVNTISGSSFFDAVTQPPVADFDSFNFIVPADTQLIAISYTAHITSSVGNPTSLRIEVFLDRFQPLAALSVEEIFLENLPGGGTLSTALPLGPDKYIVFEGQMQISAAGQRVDWDYTWSLTVAVPEPASGAMLLGALGLLGLARKRCST